MKDREHELLLKDEAFKIIGAAIEVSNNLGCGFMESVYQEALEIELKNFSIPFAAQSRIRISYKNIILEKEYIADFLCFDNIIVEIKAIKKITEIEEAQLLNYLTAAKMPLGLIINFGSPKLEWKRYANTQKISVH